MVFHYIEPSATGTAPPLFTYTIPTASAIPCYSAEKKQGVHKDKSLHPCGPSQSGVLSCCQEGDICMDNGFCLTPASSQPHYYLAGCTDPSFADPLCNRACQGENVKNVVWHDNNQTWQCCGETDDNINCAAPIGALFTAPGPLQLNKLVSLQDSSHDAGSSPLAATETVLVTGLSGEKTMVTATATAMSASKTAQPNTMPSIGPTAYTDMVVGITVGATVGVIALISLLAAGIIVVLRRSKMQKKSTEETGAEPRSERSVSLSPGVHDKMGALLASLTIQEKDEILKKIYEAHSDTKPVELDAISLDGRMSGRWTVSRSSTGNDTLGDIH